VFSAALHRLQDHLRHMEDEGQARRFVERVPVVLQE
jgi:hypothetical protein